MGYIVILVLLVVAIPLVLFLTAGGRRKRQRDVRSTSGAIPVVTEPTDEGAAVPSPKAAPRNPNVL